MTGQFQGSGATIEGRLETGGANRVDEKPKPIPQYVQRVTIDDDLEVKYWCKKFGCTANQLRVAVAKVGVMVKSVEKELAAK
jgi:hypothetical protein